MKYFNLCWKFRTRYIHETDTSTNSVLSSPFPFTRQRVQLSRRVTSVSFGTPEGLNHSWKLCYCFQRYPNLITLSLPAPTTRVHSSSHSPNQTLIHASWPPQRWEIRRYQNVNDGLLRGYVRIWLAYYWNIKQTSSVIPVSYTHLTLPTNREV